MLKKIIFHHLWLVFSWLIVISLLRWSWQISLIWLWLGALLGNFLIETDHLLYLFVTNPHELTSQRAKRFWEQRKFKDLGLLVLTTQPERNRLAFHNIFFQGILWVLCFFVLTSTMSLFVSGLVMGMALHLLQNEFQDWLLGQEERLKNWLFWPLEVDLNFSGQRIILLCFLLLFVAFSFFLF